MTVLKALARLGGAASLTTIAQQVGESTAKVHRYLASLMQEELVAQNPATQHYYLAGAAVQIGLAALRQCDPVRLGEVALLRLRDELQVTCFIAVMGNRGLAQILADAALAARDRSRAMAREYAG